MPKPDVKRPNLDLRAYLITGPVDADEVGAFDAVVDTAATAAAGGAGVVQVRSKPIEARDLYLLAREVSRAVRATNPDTLVLIDDRVDVALALRAEGEHVHGVHLGQTDLPVRTTRALLGPDAVIGLTTGTAELVAAANEVADVIDYVGCGPFRPTPTKNSGRPPIGLEGYPALVELSEVPLVAIGDVRPADAPALAATGVAGLAIVRGFTDPTTTPDAVVRAILAAFDSHAGQQEVGR